MAHPAIRVASPLQLPRDERTLVPALNPWMVLAGTVAAFAFSLAYYSIPPFAAALERLGPPAAGEVTAATLGIELLRTMLLVAGTSWFVTILRLRWRGAIAVGFVAWTTFVATQWTGAVLWNNEPVGLAMLHAGDWLGKILLIALIAGAWPRRFRATPRTMGGTSP